MDDQGKSVPSAPWPAGPPVLSATTVHGTVGKQPEHFDWPCNPRQNAAGFALGYSTMRHDYAILRKVRGWAWP